MNRRRESLGLTDLSEHALAAAGAAPGIGSVRSDIFGRVWALFKKHGIKVPFQQRDVHVKDWSAWAGPSGAGQPNP